MAGETLQTTAQVNALLANNTSGDISPLDVRDMLLSMQCYGGMNVRDGTPSQLVTSTPALGAFWTGDSPSVGIVPDSTTDNDITVPVNGLGNYKVTCMLSISVTGGAGSQEFQARMRVNDVENGIGCHRDISSSALGTTGFTDTVTLADTDTVTVWVEIAGTNRTIVFHDCALVLERLS